MLARCPCTWRVGGGVRREASPRPEARPKTPPLPGFQGSGFKSCSDFRLQGSGFRSCPDFRVQGSGFKVQGSGFRVQVLLGFQGSDVSGFRIQGGGFRVQGAGFRVQGAGLGVDLPPPPRGGRARPPSVSSAEFRAQLSRFLGCRV